MTAPLQPASCATGETKLKTVQAQGKPSHETEASVIKLKTEQAPVTNEAGCNGAFTRLNALSSARDSGGRRACVSF